MQSFTAKQKLEALERELRMRTRFYAKLVATGRMSQQKSDYEISIMRAMIDDYVKLTQSERLM